MEGQPCIANPQLLEIPCREFQREKAPPLLWIPADKSCLSQRTHTDLNGVRGWERTQYITMGCINYSVAGFLKTN